MKYTFNENLPYILLFVVFHSFLTRLQILLAFIRRLTLVKSNLSEKNLAFCAHTKLQCLFTHVVSIIFRCNGFENFLAVTVVNCLSLKINLLAPSNDV